MHNRNLLVARFCAFLIGLALSLACGLAAAESAGHVEFLTGNVVATDQQQQTRSRGKGSPIEEGDTISTNEGRVQVRFRDGAYLALQPQTVFRVNEYRDSTKGDSSDSVFLTLLKGGLRTITGAISRRNHPAYRLGTTIATIGIRGTEYALDLGAGLYGHVTEGAIQVCNGAGCLDVLARHAFFVGSPSQVPAFTEKRAFLPPPPTSPSQTASATIERPASAVRQLTTRDRSVSMGAGNNSTLRTPTLTEEDLSDALGKLGSSLSSGLSLSGLGATLQPVGTTVGTATGGAASAVSSAAGALTPVTSGLTNGVAGVIGNVAPSLALPAPTVQTGTTGSVWLGQPVLNLLTNTLTLKP